VPLEAQAAEPLLTTVPGLSDYALSGEFGDQLSLDPAVPVAGDVYRARDYNHRAVVVAVTQRRRVWVTYRAAGEERELQMGDFLGMFVPV
jgi:hypothetical protein